ncbi:MAG: hypothetical protein IJN66_00550 [Muribaculaceae bacterium]|nr:hypothetical protein [Muribaculaceae bacterium]
MKKFNFIYGAAVASMMLFASCSNDQPEFNDADAFIAFTNTALSVDEFGGSIDVPVLLTSLAGLDGEAVIEVDSTSTAIEGVHFTLPESNTITFTKDAPTQNFNIQIIDNDEFGGDKKIVLKITAVTGVNMGAVSTCVVTIADNEHPLQAILGKYVGKGESYFNGETEWSFQILKDDQDIQKVWIYPMVPAGTATGYMVYGIVNADKTEIAIPVGQDLVNDAKLEGFYGPSGDESIPTGGNITAVINDNGTIVINDWFGSNLTGTNSWYNIMVNAVWTKQ